MLWSRTSFGDIVKTIVLLLDEFAPAAHGCEDYLYLPLLHHVVLFPLFRLASTSIHTCTLSHSSAHTCTSFLTLTFFASIFHRLSSSDSLKLQHFASPTALPSIAIHQSSIMPPNQSGPSIPGPHNTPNLRQAPTNYTPQHGPRTVGSNKKYDVPSSNPSPAANDLSLPPPRLASNAVLDSTRLVNVQSLPDTDNLPPLPSSPGPVADIDCPSYGGMTTFDRMLTPPVSDINAMSEHHDVEPITVFIYSGNNGRKPNKGPHNDGGHIHHPPFRPQPSDPSKQPKRGFNITKITRQSRPNNDSSRDDSDGDVEAGDRSAEDLDPAPPTTPPTTPPTKLPGSPPPYNPTMPSHIGPMTRFQSKLKRARDEARELNANVPSSPALNDIPSPPPQTKRKRDTLEPITDSPDPQTLPPAATTGNRISKRLRNSLSEAPLGHQPPSKRTRGEQRAADEKFRKDHPYDPKHAGSVAEEEVEIKSRGGPWKAGFLHTKPFDGSRDGQ